MRIAEFPHNEQDRLSDLYSYALLDTLPEQDYDDITKLASQICDTPISLVTLIDSDRQWFKAAYGLADKQTSRDQAFCAHAILHPSEIMIVPDADKDERFADNPLVTGDMRVVFYAGVPLLSEEGFPLGSLCVIDNKPKELTELQLQSLKMLANQAMRLMQLHKKTRELSHSRQLLQEVNKELEKFAQVVAGSLIMPCNNAIEFTELITEKYTDKLDVDGKQLLSLVKYSCESIKATIDKTLQQAHTVHLLHENKSLFTFTEMMQDLKQLLPSLSESIKLNYLPNDNKIYSFKQLLLKIIANIVLASVQYNDKQERTIEIAYRQNAGNYTFTITDNGKGIPVFLRNNEFYLLQPASNNEKDADYITGLNAVKSLVTTLSGSVDINFEENSGSVFSILIPK